MEKAICDCIFYFPDWETANYCGSHSDFKRLHQGCFVTTIEFKGRTIAHWVYYQEHAPVDNTQIVSVAQNHYVTAFELFYQLKGDGVSIHFDFYNVWCKVYTLQLLVIRDVLPIDLLRLLKGFL